MNKKMMFIGIVVLLLSFGSMALGQANIGLMGIGGFLGYIGPEDPIESTIMFGGRADLGTIMPKLGLMAEVAYWSKGYDSHSSGFDYEWSWSQIYITALAKYGFGKDPQGVNPYVGGGLGLVIGKWEYKSSHSNPLLGSLDESDSASETDIGIHILGGVEYPFSPKMDGYAEFRYILDGADLWGIFGGINYKLK